MAYPTTSMTASGSVARRQALPQAHLRTLHQAGDSEKTMRLYEDGEGIHLKVTQQIVPEQA